MSVLTSLTARPVIGHRGNSAHAPENTFASFDQAVALGADAIEFDVRLTRDGVPVVLHDATVDRTTDGRGAVAAMTLAELRRLDAGARFCRDGRTFPYRGQGVTVPTLDELLARYPNVPLLIEVKLAAAAGPTARALEAAGALDRTVIDSMELDAVVPFRGRVTTGASMRGAVALLARSWLPFGPSSLPFQALCIPPRYSGVPVPVLRLARAARRAGSVTHVWTVNSPEQALALWRGGVQGIVTDDPGVMLRLRAREFGDGDAGTGLATARPGRAED